MDVNQHDRLGTTPLQLAAEWGHIKIVKLLLAHGADVDLADNKGRTALSVAACQEYKATVRLLLDAGAQIDIRDKAGYTPVILATMRNRYAIVELLVQSGADVNLASKRGRTALSFGRIQPTPYSEVSCGPGGGCVLCLSIRTKSHVLCGEKKEDIPTSHCSRRSGLSTNWLLGVAWP